MESWLAMLTEHRAIELGSRWHPALAPVLRWSPAHPGGGGSHGVIVIIEDDEAIGLMYRLQLESDGYLIHHTPDGRRGLELIRHVNPDLVLLDLRLPGIDGMEILRSLRTSGSMPPTVVVSNYSDPELVRAAKQLGAIDFLVKARILPGDLSERIPGWIEVGGRRLQ